MDWNNYFLSRSNQNYNFVPGGFTPVNNAAIYQSSDQNWQYYGPYSQNFIPESSNPQHEIPPPVTSTYGGNFVPLSRDLSGDSGRSSMSVSFAEGSHVGSSDGMHPPTDALSSILMASSLTPTAGEFVPRSKAVKQTSSEKPLHQDLQTGASVFSGSQKQISEINSVKELKSVHVGSEFVDTERKHNNSEQSCSNSIGLTNSIVNTAVEISFNSIENSSNNNFSNKMALCSKSVSNHKSGDSNNKLSDATSHAQSNNDNVNSKSKSETSCSLGESEVIPRSGTENSRGQSAPLRRGSGRLLQNRVNETPRGSNMSDSKSIGRHNLLSQASTFYGSSYSEGRPLSEKGNSSQNSNNEESYQNDITFGRKTRDNNDKYNGSGKPSYDKSMCKVVSKQTEGLANSLERENVNDKSSLPQNSEYCTEHNDKLDKREKIARNDKFNRFDRMDREARQSRSERKDSNFFPNRGERPYRCDRQDRGGDRQDRGGDRSDWSIGQEKDDSQERGFRQPRLQKSDRQDRGSWFDRNNRVDRSYQRLDLSNAGNRSGKGDAQIRQRSFREDKFESNGRLGRGNRYDRMDRGDRYDGSNWMVGSEKHDNRLNRGNRMDRGDRSGRGDSEEKREGEYKVDKTFKDDRNDQMNRNDNGKQKTFFNSRFKNYDSSQSRREEWSDSGTHFYNKGQRHTSNFHSRCESYEKGIRKDEVIAEYQPSSHECNRISPESEIQEAQKSSGLNNYPTGSRTSDGLEKDRNSKSIKTNSLQVTYNSEIKIKNFNQGFFTSGDDDASQRERLSDQLSRGTLECLVCCERVRQHDAVWSCSNCYHVLHLRCIKKWAKSSKVESGWRCPACQNVSSKVPQDYRCFCGKMRDPEWNRQDLPHTCGEMCGRSRKPRNPELGSCTHRCTLLCHPGPCPVCVAQVSRSCGCGKTSQVVSCGNSQPLLCEALCEKLLNCGSHHCMKTCHWGPCGDCEEIVKQVCHCSKVSREVKCTVESALVEHFSCEEVCAKVLECKNHFCPLMCHEGSCSQCELTPERVTRCPCGKTALDEDCIRTSCQDPIPTCGQQCRKQLSCGQPGKYHDCQAECHTGSCPQCPLTTFVKCRCGHMDREIECKDLKTKADDARCEKRCSKKRACGKHKCNQACCIDIDHQCPLPCNHTLSCGLHKCEELCHRGHCPPCWRTSFEELYCECGANVIYPPVPCGTRKPACTNPCTRQHPCDHQALHQCHSEPSCPPCTVLMERYCYGKHELRKAVPCHRTEFSCGMPCGLPLPCGQHTCILPCHKGPCVREGQPICTQPCKTTRSICGHPCAAPCHEGDCPDSPCKETVRVTCECGHRSTTRPCCDQTKEYHRVLTTQLASKMQDVLQGLSVDISDLSAARSMSLKTLECNDECKIIERNRRLAIGLQIRNPDLSSKLQPRYSEFMRQWGKKDPFFVAMVHEKLTELVQLAKQSKQKSRSYSFSSMNRDKRHFIHEYCEHFGCESQAYDPEPNRNVVATAQRDRAWLPSMSLLEVLQRESGQRKVPKPVTAWAVDTKIKETLSWRSSSLTKSDDVSKSDKEANKKTGEVNNEKEGKEQQKEEEVIDYFEMTS